MLRSPFPVKYFLQFRLARVRANGYNKREDILVMEPAMDGKKKKNLRFCPLDEPGYDRIVAEPEARRTGNEA